MGRKPANPEVTLKLGGRADRVKETIQAVKGKPVPDASLDEVALAEFERIVTILDLLGITSKTDGPVISIYADNYSRWCRAREVLSIEGEYTISQNGYPMTHPAVKVLEKCVTLMHRSLQDMGLTPASRKRVPVDKSSDAIGDKWQGLV